VNPSYVYGVLVGRAVAVGAAVAVRSGVLVGPVVAVGGTCVAVGAAVAVADDSVPAVVAVGLGVDVGAVRVNWMGLSVEVTNGVTVTVGVGVPFL